MRNQYLIGPKTPQELEVEKSFRKSCKTFVNALTSFGAVFAFTGMIIGIVALSQDRTAILPVPPAPANARITSAYTVRADLAQQNAGKGPAEQRNNGDPSLGRFTKGLQHNSLGEVDPDQYERFRKALDERQFDRLPRAAVAQRLFVSPQAGLAFNLVAGDPQQYTIPPAPAFNSTELAAEYIENAWMAVTRDIPFAEYGTSPLTVEAAAELNGLGNDFKGVTPVNTGNLFRGLSPGCLSGPYLSQFFYIPTMYGMHAFNLKVQPRAPGVDFMTTFAEYLRIQNGQNPTGIEQVAGSPRYMISGRDISNWVHVDMLWQAYHTAVLTLFHLKAPLNPTNPYLSSSNQEGFATFGMADIITKVAQVGTPALHTVWYQKWFNHLRMRPEVFGARIHVNRTMNIPYPIAQSALASAANSYIFAATSHYLLPQAFPEGSPMHPSYGAGHGTVAGACTTIAKAFFDESWVIPNPVTPDATGANLLPINVTLTVGGELNKIANNVAIGRNIAGVHWRSDATQSLRLGEQVAIDFLRDYKRTYNENFVGWRFTDFQGNTVVI